MEEMNKAMQKMTEILEANAKAMQAQAFQNIEAFLLSLKTTKSNRLSNVTMPVGYSMNEITTGLSNIGAVVEKNNQVMQIVANQLAGIKEASVKIEELLRDMRKPKLY